MISSGFTSSKYDECVYIKVEGGAAVAYLLLYVDDILFSIGWCMQERSTEGKGEF